jgi:hypothetical protein
MAIMAVKLNKPGFDHAKYVIALGHVVFDDRDAWSDPQNAAAHLHGTIEAAKPTPSAKAFSTKRSAARTAATK